MIISAVSDADIISDDFIKCVENWLLYAHLNWFLVFDYLFYKISNETKLLIFYIHQL